MTVRDARLATLFLRSRQTTPIVLALTGVALAAGLSLAASNNADLTRLLRMVVPLAVAVVIGVATASPFGEIERIASRPLPPIRFGHLGLLLTTTALLVVIATTAASDGGIGILLRNGAGFAGLALLGARFLGPGISWTPPLGYAAAVFADFLVKPARDATWRWPLQSAGDNAATTLALALFCIGLTAVTLRGSRDTSGEAI